MGHLTWVFGCDAPLDRFQQQLLRSLREDGWEMLPAQVYDLGCARRGVRAYLKLRCHDRGVELRVKVKPGFRTAAATRDAERALWSAARKAQLALAGPGQRASPSDPGLPSPHRPGASGVLPASPDAALEDEQGAADADHVAGEQE